MQDRLQDLHLLESSSDFNEAEMQDIAINVEDGPAGLQEFNNNFSNIKANIDTLKQQIERLDGGHRSVLVLTDTASQEELNRQLESDIDSLVRFIGNDLKTMSNDIKNSTEHVKWKTNIHSLITKQFMDILTSYRSKQSEYRDKINNRIRQRVLLVNPKASTEEIEGIVETGNLNIFAQEISTQNISQGRDALNFVERRHEEVLKIEESVKDLHQIFTDMGLLIDQQGEFIDNIESNVASSVLYVKEGNVNLVAAMKIKSRKRWCCCSSLAICLLLVAAGIILLIIFGNAANWWIKK